LIDRGWLLAVLSSASIKWHPASGVCYPIEPGTITLMQKEVGRRIVRVLHPFWHDEFLFQTGGWKCPCHRRSVCLFV